MRRVAVTGTAPAIGEVAQLGATAILSNAETRDVTTLATWQTSDAAIATISSGGVAVGVAAGAATISATYQGVTGSEVIVVAPLPCNPSIGNSVHRVAPPGQIQVCLSISPAR